MAFKIRGIDLNPTAGDSWMGLTREQAKKVANVFLLIGILLSIPPIIPDPTDFINFFLASRLEEKFSMPYTQALLTTYFIGFALVITGAWIYPYNTHSLLNGYVNKLKMCLKKAIKNPVLLAIGLLIFMFIYNWYATMI